MTDARSWLHARAGQHLPRTARKYQYRTWTGEAKHNMLGGISFLKPAEGTVADQDAEYILIKEKGNQFALLYADLANTPVNTGDKVVATFFQLKDFQGLSSDGSNDPVETLQGGFTSRSIALTGAKTNFPYTWEGRYTSRNLSVTRTWTQIQNPYLHDLIKQMEGIPVDSCRTIADLLVSAKARNLAVFDPVENKSCDEDRMKWPSIAMDVTTTKFTGNVAIRYDRAADTYTIDFRALDGTVDTHDDIHFDGIGDLLLHHIDDGSWKMVAITILKKAAKKREVA